MIYTCLLGSRKCALYDSFLLPHCVVFVHPLQKIREETVLGKVLGLQLISITHLTDKQTFEI